MAEGRRAWRASTRDRHVGFDDPHFTELSRLVHRVRSIKQGDWKVDRSTLWALVRLPVLLASLERLPTRRIPVTDGAAGRAVRAYFDRAADARRLMAISTLALPSVAGEYRRGRSKQALRTNCSRARQAGVEVLLSSSRDETLARMRDLFERRSDPDGGAWYFDRAGRQEGEFWFATAADGHALVVAEVVVDECTALLRSMISGPGEGRSEARYLVMAEMIESLVQRGIEYLLVDRALSVPPGLVHFQRLLGFAPANLAFAPGPGPRSHRYVVLPDDSTSTSVGYAQQGTRADRPSRNVSAS